ncbi:hypothetical protein Tco_1477019 [Tanacetum coccineum]
MGVGKLIKEYQTSQSLTRHMIQSERRDAYTHTPNLEDPSTRTKDKKNRLMRIDELTQVQADGTLDDVRNAIDNGLKKKEDNEEFGEICWWKTIWG